MLQLDFASSCIHIIAEKKLQWGKKGKEAAKTKAESCKVACKFSMVNIVYTKNDRDNQEKYETWKKATKPNPI